jgi:hypothetical protein
MSLPLNWFLNPSETKENVGYFTSRYNPAQLDSYNKPSLPFMQQIREYTRTVPLTAAVSSALQTMSQYVGNMLETVPKTIDTVVESVKEATHAAVNEVGENIVEVAENVGEAVVVKKTFPKVQTPYIKNGKLYRIGAGSTRKRRHRSRSRSPQKRSYRSRRSKSRSR